MDEVSKSKSVVPFNEIGLPADVSGLRAYAHASKLDGNTEFLKVNGKTGDVTYGRDEEALPEDAELVVFIGQAEVGFMEWEND
jgi:hypothetical protein